MSNRREGDWYPTSYKIAEKIISMMNFFSGDSFLDPCKGREGNEPFFSAFPDGHEKNWCEIDEGVDFFKQNKSYDVIISNPPFNIAKDFIKKSVEDLNDGGTLVFLLRLNYLGSRDRYKTLWNDDKYKPKMIITLAERPSFTGDGKTDQTEYAFFVWGNTSRFKNQSPIQWMSWK